ncbi:MAG TPA: GerMN domain-containing protein [Spirochaetales bacterium]|nr:GerMN domain-containing protein [Spirochaetales bacterium]HRY55662.1 GerMN domain-containing protein [Spirochaetia bacterium]
MSGQAGCLLWLIALVVILLLFLVNLGKIKATLERTNFREIVRTQRDKEAEKPQSPPVQIAPKVEEPLPAAEPAAGKPAASKPVAEKPAPENAAPEKPAASKPVAKGAEKKPAEAPKQPPAAPATEKPPAQRYRQASLFFVRIDDDGVIVRQEVKRSVPASDSPLADALAALLRGPTEEELRRKLLSLVPEGTALLGAQVRGSTAFLNFNEAFMYNHYGIEGYAGQLKQVVYTATAFPTVQDVQILVEGERHDYLGGEGVYIGRPLSRNSF